MSDLKADQTTARVMRRFTKLEPLDVAFPLTGAKLDELGIRGLQCGCGDAVRVFWLNSDTGALGDESGATTEPGRLYQLDDGPRYYFHHDALEPYPLQDASVNAAYSEHFIEHVEPGQAIAWLREMHRVMRPGAVIRIVTPDMRKYVEGYLDPEGAFFAEHRSRVTELLDPEALERRCFMVNQTFQFWGHKWIYDFDELRYALGQAGFDEGSVEERGYRESQVPELTTMDIPARNDESIYVEARKG